MIKSEVMKSISVEPRRAMRTQRRAARRAERASSSRVARCAERAARVSPLLPAEEAAASSAASSASLASSQVADAVVVRGARLIVDECVVRFVRLVGVVVEAILVVRLIVDKVEHRLRAARAPRRAAHAARRRVAHGSEARCAPGAAGHDVHGGT